MTTYDPNDFVRHISGPHHDPDGLVSGEIELPGGLPPEDDDEDEERDGEQRRGEERFEAHRWDDAMGIAERDGFVLFDPDTPSGFRALTPAERSELADTVRAGSPSFTREAPEPAVLETRAHDPGRIDPRVTADGTPWVDSPRGVAERERWAIENADPAKARDDSDPDDIDRLQQRLDDLRVRLTGYTWREGVDRDQALAERREQLGRWHDDDHAETGGDPDADSETADGGFPGRGQCLIYPDDPRWSP